MSIARFKVSGQLDGAGGLRPGTIEIDREAGTITVRPKRSHTTYTMTLGEVATFVCVNIIRGGKLAEALVEKKPLKLRRST